MTIHGNATGLTEQTTTLALTVSAATGGSGNTTCEFCTADKTPIWFAIQDGATGTWTRVTPTGHEVPVQHHAGEGWYRVRRRKRERRSSGSASRSFAARLTAELQQELLLRNRPTRCIAYAAARSPSASR